MTESGETKDDVKIPDDEVGQKINKLFREDEKDTSKESDHSCSPTAANVTRRRYRAYCYGRGGRHRRQGGPQVLNHSLHEPASGGMNRIHTPRASAMRRWLYVRYELLEEQHETVWVALATATAKRIGSGPVPLGVCHTSTTRPSM